MTPSNASTPLIFINIGWMNEYQGPQPNDPAPQGGHAYLKRKGTVGHEAWNFRPYRGDLYGYVPREPTINLKRLGSPVDGTLNGVTAVWIARDPSNGKTYIVGWYRNATVTELSREVRRSRHQPTIHYQIRARGDDAKLLPPAARRFPIPTSKEPGNLGQSPVWYGKDDAFRDAVLAYIGAGGAIDPPKGKPGQRKRGGFQPDAVLRRKVEKAAVDAAIRYFESPEGGNCRVESVESLALGWDLNAVDPFGRWNKVEVKGTLMTDVAAELTPNEYKQMQSPAHREDYIVFVVTEALDNPTIHCFRFDAENSHRGKLIWKDAGGRQLRFKKQVAAIISAT